jgi:hypothetical protein
LSLTDQEVDQYSLTAAADVAGNGQIFWVLIQLYSETYVWAKEMWCLGVRTNRMELLSAATAVLISLLL